MEEININRRVDSNRHRFRWAAAIWTGVALMVSGCADAPAFRDIKPSCEAPARLEGKFDARVPDLLIRLRPAPDVASVASDLASRYGFSLRSVLSHAPAIITDGPLTPQTIAALRCDSAVETVSHDAVLEHVI